MKILLIAYEFPPIVAAQSLRWHYLANELARQGSEVHVVSPAMPAASSFPPGSAAALKVHRTWPGPFVGLSQRLSARVTGERGASSAHDIGVRRPAFLRAYVLARKLLDAALYPDVRTEWYPYARRRIKELLAAERFDLVVSSHEPGVDLLLGLWVKRTHGLPWLVDLADPLLAPYSPKWRRWLDRRVERRVLFTADGVMVTTPRLVDLLCHRHGERLRNRFHVVPQGFHVATAPRPARTADGVLKLLYTGTFYREFRNPAQLAQALRALSDRRISLTIVGDNAAVAPLFHGIPGVRFLAKSDHFACLAMQREADVLLNMGNSQDYQVPGKIYEYLGAGRPILHIRSAATDHGADLIAQTGAGWVVDNEAAQIQQALERLLQAWGSGELESGIGRHEDLIGLHSWEQRASACLRAMEDMLTACAARGSA